MSDLIQTALATLPTAKEAKRYNDALLLVELYAGEKAILKTEHASLRSAINRGFDLAWRQVVREPFLNAGRWESLNEHERKLEEAINYPEVHTAAGQLKRVVAAEKAAGPLRDAMLSVLTEAAAVAAQVDALKTKIGKREPKATKTSIERAEREAKAMTCQCCNRPILAETGLIAHHGYERPGSGWQTASCPGARELPFEVSRDALGRFISTLEAYVERQSLLRAKLRENAEDLRVCWTYSDRSACTQAWHRGVDKKVIITRAEFPVALEEAKTLGYKGLQTFDGLREAEIAQTTQHIEATKRHIAHQQVRYGAWKQTHTRSGDAWAKLEEEAA